MSVETTGQSTYASQFNTLLAAREGESQVSLAERRTAFERFSRAGFPTRHDEEWRFTPIAGIAETPFEAAAASAEVTVEEVAALPFGGLAFPRLVFVNGVLAPHLSSAAGIPDGISIASLAGEEARADAASLHTAPAAGGIGAFWDLNMAFGVDGALIRIADNAQVETPLHLLYITRGGNAAVMAHPRSIIHAGRNSRATILESYASLHGAACLTNSVTQVVCGQDSVVDHYKLQSEDLAAYHVGQMDVEVGRGAVFSSQAITLGGAIVRNEVRAVMNGEHGECTLNGLYLVDGRRTVDNHTAIDHALPNCNSHEVYKGILADRSRGVFNGKIYVRQDAQKTDAKQTNKTLLLSDEAQIFTKPQLEIYADDVKCTHGATVGQLNPDQLFYLRSRGIGPEQARGILVRAFAEDVVQRIGPAEALDEVERLMVNLLPQESE